MLAPSCVHPSVSGTAGRVWGTGEVGLRIASQSMRSEYVSLDLGPVARAGGKITSIDFVIPIICQPSPVLTINGKWARKATKNRFYTAILIWCNHWGHWAAVGKATLSARPARLHGRRGVGSQDEGQLFGHLPAWTLNHSLGCCSGTDSPKRHHHRELGATWGKEMADPVGNTGGQSLSSPGETPTGHCVGVTAA